MFGKLSLLNKWIWCLLESPFDRRMQCSVRLFLHGSEVWNYHLQYAFFDHPLLGSSECSAVELERMEVGSRAFIKSTRQSSTSNRKPCDLFGAFMVKIRSDIRIQEALAWCQSTKSLCDLFWHGNSLETLRVSWMEDLKSWHSRWCSNFMGFFPGV